MGERVLWGRVRILTGLDLSNIMLKILFHRFDLVIKRSHVKVNNLRQESK